MPTNIYSDQSRQANWFVRKKTDVTLTLTVTQSSVAYDLSTTTFIAEFFQVNGLVPFLTLTQGSGITNGGVTGIVTLALDNTQLDLVPNQYWWKLRTTAPTDYLWLNGVFQVNDYVWDGDGNSSAAIDLTVGNNNIDLALTISGAATLASIGTLLQTAATDTPLDADTSYFWDAVDAVLKKWNWAAKKALLKTYFDGIYESLTNKDATGGYVGLTLFKINFKNVANTFTSFFTNSNTAARTYTFPDKDLTVVGTVDVIGLQDLYIPAVAMWPRTTGGCASLAKTEMTTSLVNIQSLDFDQTTSEYAQFTISLPKNWNNGTVTATVYWTAASGSGTVIWGIQGGAYSNDDALTVALGTAQTTTDTLIAANDLHISPATSAITLAGTPADADFLAFQIYRDISDTLTADAKLLGVVVQLTTDAAVSA